MMFNFLKKGKFLCPNPTCKCFWEVVANAEKIEDPPLLRSKNINST
ncbi:hypothetical protein MtrunA17_Chr7g0244211 [Medicago truncatula]|uniref:Uncharacterized protein n=1 Tax=Medicago truncatula TaxID=3880 RepID=A0A396H1M7_MEDTR|nr:hypothetical protein MtrunA17_Chr7g0244211 [Medicago truncatula]